MASARGEHTVKGTHVIVASQFVDENLGAGTFRKLTESGGQRWAVLLPSSWYELDILHAALLESSRRLSRDIHQMSTEIAARNAKTDLTGVYRFVMKALAPHRVLSQLPHLWRFYVRFGECAPLSNEKGHYIAEGRGMLHEYAEWATGCWRGFISTAVEMSGGKDVRVQIGKPWPEPDGSRFRFEIFYS
jgi:uncharacterized protein (TIGR02265 family)